MSNATPLHNLRRKSIFYRHDAPGWVRNIWDRPESFNWFIKHNREVLVQSGALVKLGRDYFVDVEIFPQAAERVLGIRREEQ